jgi:hypothetical protein
LDLGWILEVAMKFLTIVDVVIVHFEGKLARIVDYCKEAEEEIDQHL